MRVVDEPVEDGVAKRGVPDQVMPVFDRHLTGDQRGPATAASPCQQVCKWRQAARSFRVGRMGRTPS